MVPKNPPKFGLLELKTGFRQGLSRRRSRVRVPSLPSQSPAKPGLFVGRLVGSISVPDRQVAVGLHNLRLPSHGAADRPAGAMCGEPHGRSESKYAVSAPARPYGPTHRKTDDAEEA